MVVKRMLAQLTVTELEASVAWYGRLFGRRPDDRPMDGLAAVPQSTSDTSVPSPRE